MPNTDDSDEDTTPTPMDATDSNKPAENGSKRAKKGPSEKPPQQPFFTMNDDGSLKSYMYKPEILKHVAALTLHEMDRQIEHEKMMADHAQSVRDKMLSEKKNEKEITEFIESRKGLDPGFTEYEPKILIDPDVPREVLEQISSDKTSLHSSLGNALECMNGNTENRPFACDSISDVGAKKRAKKQNIPIACLAYEGNKQKVSGGAIDQVFGINQKNSATVDEEDPPRKKGKTVDEAVSELDAETCKSGYDLKVKLYNREMERDGSDEFRTRINDGKCSLEDMVKGYWEDDKKLFSRSSTKKNDADDLTDDQKAKAQKEAEKEVVYVKKVSESIRKDIVKKYCEVNEANIKKSATLKLSRDDDKKGNKMGKKAIDDKKLQKIMDETRKEMKTKLLDKKDPKLETLAKELLVYKMRKTNLKKSKIVCPTSLDVYTPLTNTSPCGRVNMTPQHAKLIQKKKGKVMEKYAAHALKLRKKGLCIKIWA